MFAAGGGGGAIKIGAVVAASSILAGAGIVVLAGGNATDAPASFSAFGDDSAGRGATEAPASFMAGGGEAEAVVTAVNMEVEVDVGGAGAAAWVPAGAITTLGATTAGASAGSWIWPSLIWETMFARARGDSERKREILVRLGILAVFLMLLRCLCVVFCFGEELLSFRDVSKSGRDL